jgi:hypothetical protein
MAGPPVAAGAFCGAFQSSPPDLLPFRIGALLRARRAIAMPVGMARKPVVAALGDMPPPSTV